MEQGLTKNELLKEISRSPHSALNEYIPIFKQAVVEDPEFAAHFIAWNAQHGQIRDANTALPIISLAVKGFNDSEYLENSLAHLAKLSPRDLYMAYMFAKGSIRNKEVVTKVGVAEAGKKPKISKQRVGGWKKFGPGLLGPAQRMNMLDRLVARYLRSRESNQHEFDRNVLNFRQYMRKLYYTTHTVPSARAKDILNEHLYRAGSSLEAVQNLSRMDPKIAAAAIIQHRIPFLSLFPILGSKVKDPVLLMAIIEQMSPSELQTHLPQLEKLGVKDYPETRVALDNAFEKLAGSKKTVLKTGKQAAKIQNVELKAKVQAVAERQITSALKGIEGNWAVLADKSSSMGIAVETAKLVASILARMVKGKVALVFFNDSPQYVDVTGKSLEEIKHMTRGVVANGWTSIGCALESAIGRGLDIDGIAVVSDGGENKNPLFHSVYGDLLKRSGKSIPVYYYKVKGTMSGGDSLQTGMRMAGHSMELFDLSAGVDDYSLPNLVQTMRANRYSILDEVMETKLITLDQVLGVKGKEELVLTV